MPITPSIATTLSQGIVEAFAVAGFTQQDILAGAIEFTDLPWQIPPLVTEATLLGAPLSEYMDRPVYVDAEAMVNMWSEALANLKNAPDKVVTFDGYRGAAYSIPAVRRKDRALLLSIPEGFPGNITDLAATTLSLECAHLLRANSKNKQFVSDEDNYYAVTSLGVEVGIKDGVPAMYGDIWDIPSHGMVQELLRTPRGTVFEGCDHNVIAKVRSVAYTYNRSLRDYEAVEWALQALRAIEGDRELLKAIQSIKKVTYVRKMRHEALAEALQVVNRMSITDRQRIETLKHLLVPEVLSPGEFTKQLYPFNKLPPPVLAEKVILRLRQNVAELFAHEEAIYAMSTRPQRSV